MQEQEGTREKNMTLEQARAVINEEDEIILQAFVRRMEAARQIGLYKADHGMPIRMPAREEEIYARVRAAVPPALADYAARLFETLIDVSSEYQNEGRTFGLLGRRLSHSFSPAIHAALGAWCEPYRYHLFEKEPQEVEDFVRCGDWTGLNVTIPYKETVIPFCDELTETARRVGAVNTLVKRGGRICGDNTDYEGFRDTVVQAGAPVAGAKCVVLGSGGASKTVTCVLQDLGAKSVVVVSRDGRTGCDYAGLQAHRDATILVNATPVGMYPDTGRAAVNPGMFPQLRWACDLIFNPLRTNLLLQAERSFVEISDGLHMLVVQAKASAERFLGTVIEAAAVPAIEGALRAEKQNLVLIGMPGCGKSTIGRALAARTGRPFIDTDERIVERTGSSIPDIFAGGGEPEFRRIEGEVIESLRHTTGAVIACGGGVVTREENYYALAENGYLIFLDRRLSDLPTDGRPISQTTPLSRLRAARLPLYRSWCDAEIVNDDKTVEAVVDEILLGTGLAM